MDAQKNLPVAYDDHGDIPLNVPFSALRPQDITFYLEMNTRVGKDTCRQRCEHCFYIREQEARDRSMDLAEGQKLLRNLRAHGYKVLPLVSDAFSNKGEFLSMFGVAVGSASPMHDYREGSERQPSQTMERGEMWTSGAPLLDDDAEEMLCRGLENGFGTVTITFHGVPDERLQLLPRETYPIRGVFAGQDCERVIQRVHAFNDNLVAGRIDRLRTLPQELRRPLRINLTVTIGRHNHSRVILERYIRYMDRLGVSLLRFNRFHDHGGRHPELVLSRLDVEALYRDFKWLHERIPFQFQMALSEDFGTHGIGVMGFPSHTGHCRAGHQFFAIAAAAPVILNEDTARRQELVGIVVGCVEAYKPILGRVLRITDKTSDSVNHSVEFYKDEVEALMRKRMDGTYTDGCFAPELLREVAKKERDARLLPVVSRATISLEER